MTMSDLKELLSELDFEQWLDMEGIIYRRGGVSARGREVNIKECRYVEAQTGRSIST